MSLNRIRSTIINSLWQSYLATTPVVQKIVTVLSAQQIPIPPLDHFAIIDLPSEHTGIKVLREIFECLQFEYKGSGYLPDKQNGFVWLCEWDAATKLPQYVLPQVVVADFNLYELPPHIVKIVSNYASLAAPFPFNEFDGLLARLESDETAEPLLIKLIEDYFSGRAWAMPTCHEIEQVKKVNELLAWVLVFGRRPNHFTFAMHLNKHFPHFDQFLDWVEHELAIPLNHQGGRIKGHAESGIQQAATHLPPEPIQLADGTIHLSAPFVEFVWRYPILPTLKPTRFADYFTDFIAVNANNVVESLYDKERT